MQPQRSKASYRAHRYSGPKRGRKASRAQLKRHHGDTNTTHEDLWRKKLKPNKPIENESIPSTRKKKTLNKEADANYNKDLVRSAPSSFVWTGHRTDIVQALVAVLPPSETHDTMSSNQQGYQERIWFPTNPFRCAEWISIVAQERREEHYKPYKNSTICSIHFDKFDISGNTQRCRLAKTAIPKLQETQNAEVAGPSSQLQAEPQQNNQQDICMQIKSSLQKLRRKSNPEPEKPMLELEVFPEPREVEIDIDYTQQFEDESQPIEEEDPKIEEVTKVATKRKITKLLQLAKPKKPKRNPRRKVVTKRLQEESIQAAIKAPRIEKVFLDKSEETQATDVPTSLEQKEKLYEFGKFIAEQLMTFNQKDVEEAQTEIKEVLKKYRLKHKIMNCLTKTNSAEPPATNRSNETNPVVSNRHPKFQSEPRQGSTTSKPVVQQKSVKHDRHRSALQAAIQKTKPSNVSRALTLGKSTIAKTYPGKATNANKGTPECAEQAPVVQPPALPTLALGSRDIPLSLVLEPSEDGTLKLTTARVDSTGTIMTFPNAPRVNIEALTPNLSHPVLPGASTILTTTQPVPQISVGKTVAQMPQTSVIVQQTSTPVLTNTQECLIENTYSQHGNMLDPLKVEPSEANEGDIESKPELNKELVSENQTEANLVVFKCEMSSDEDDNC